MRIAFDAKRYFNNSSGLGNFSRSLVHSLASRFPNDEFILFHEKPVVFDSPFENVSVFSPSQKSILWRTLGIAKDAANLGIDVFHGLSNEIPAGLANKGIRSMVTIHDVIFKRYPGLYPTIDRWIYNRKTAFALKNADKVVAASHATAADLQTFYQFPTSNSEVIYQPIAPEFYELQQKHETVEVPYFVYVSSFTRRKNHGALIEAFAKIQKQCDWNLLLVGIGGETLHEVRNYVQHEKLENRVRIMHDLSQLDLIQLMQGASGFVYPSLFEGFGIPLAEAAVCGLPMAVSNIPVFKELAENAAIYFHPNNANEIADSMLQLYRGEIAASLALQRPQILNKINPDFIADAYMELYKI